MQSPQEIVQKEHPVLRQTAEEVRLDEITQPKVQKVIANMKDALAQQHDGVGLAAPQIAVPLRIFIVSKKVFNEFKNESDIPEEKSRADDMVCINPQIIRQSKKRISVPEGCLSVRWLYGKTARTDKATIRAYDEKGKVFTYGASGLLAQIFQHEVDHLNGILFIDHAKDVEKVEPHDIHE